MQELSNKYRCPNCGCIPEIHIEGASSHIKCCSIYIIAPYAHVVIRNWKKIVRLMDFNKNKTIMFDNSSFTHERKPPGVKAPIKRP